MLSDADKGERLYTADIKNFYLNNPMNTFKYIKIPIHLFTDEILQECNISDIVHHGYIYVEIRKGIYGLKEAHIFAYAALVKHLEPYGYYTVRYTP